MKAFPSLQVVIQMIFYNLFVLLKDVERASVEAERGAMAPYHRCNRPGMTLLRCGGAGISNLKEAGNNSIVVAGNKTKKSDEVNR